MKRFLKANADDLIRVVALALDLQSDQIFGALHTWILISKEPGPARNCAFVFMHCNA